MHAARQQCCDWLHMYSIVTYSIVTYGICTVWLYWYIRYVHTWCIYGMFIHGVYTVCSYMVYIRYVYMAIPWEHSANEMPVLITAHSVLAMCTGWLIPGRGG